MRKDSIVMYSMEFDGTLTELCTINAADENAKNFSLGFDWILSNNDFLEESMAYVVSAVIHEVVNNCMFFTLYTHDN